MNADQAMSAVGRLVGGTPGPWDELAVQTYADEFESWTGPHAGEVLGDVVAELVRTWTGDELFGGAHRPSIADVRERWLRAMAVRTPAILPPASNVHCDGSGWRPGDDGAVPCARCNPALAAVYADPAKLERWRDGVSVADLDVGVEQTRKGLQYVDRRERVKCEPWPDEPVPPAQGRRAAWQGYVEVCAEDGRVPEAGKFAAWLTPT